MKALRIVALVSTLLIALANLPIAFTAEDQDVPHWIQWPATVLGVLGLVVFIALLTRLDSAVLGVLIVGACNVAAGIYVMADGHGSGVVGLVLGGIAVLAAAGMLRAPVSPVRA